MCEENYATLRSRWSSEEKMLFISWFNSVFFVFSEIIFIYLLSDPEFVDTL